MKIKILHSLICIFFITSSITTNAMVIGDPPNLVECMQALNNQNIDTLIHTGGFYHVGDGVLSIEKENLSYVNRT